MDAETREITVRREGKKSDRRSTCHHSRRPVPPSRLTRMHDIKSDTSLSWPSRHRSVRQSAPCDGALRLGIVTFNEGLVPYCVANSTRRDVDGTCPGAGPFARAWATRLTAARCNIVALGLQESLSEAVAETLLRELDAASSGDAETAAQHWKVLHRGELRGVGKGGRRSLRLVVFACTDGCGGSVRVVASGSSECPRPLGVSRWTAAGLRLSAQSLGKSKGLVWARLAASFRRERRVFFTLTTAHLPFGDDYEAFLLARRTCLRAAAGLECFETRSYPAHASFLFGDLNFRSSAPGQQTSVRADWPPPKDDPSMHVLGEGDFRTLWCGRDDDEAGDELGRVLAAAGRQGWMAGQRPVRWREDLGGEGSRAHPFVPTCKLALNRDAECQRAEPGSMPLRCFAWQKRTPSWCDRILVWVDSAKVSVLPQSYTRVDVGTMNLTDHASVVGVYDLTVQTPHEDNDADTGTQ